MRAEHEAGRLEWSPFPGADYSPHGKARLPKMRRCPTCGAMCLPPCYGCRLKSGEARREHGLLMLRRRMLSCSRAFRINGKQETNCQVINDRFRGAVHAAVRAVHDAVEARLLPRWPSIAWIARYADATDDDWQGAWDDILTMLSRSFPGRFDEAAWLIEPGSKDELGRELPLIQRRGRAYSAACNALLEMAIEAAGTCSGSRNG